jgi:hypothetical protein
LNAAYALTVRGAADMLERWSTECLLFWRLAGVASMANCRMRLLWQEGASVAATKNI